MQRTHSARIGRHRTAARVLRRLPAAALAAGLAAAGWAPAALAEDIVASVIIETNWTDCDVGLQIFLDSDAWKVVTVTDPDGKKVYEVKGLGALAGHGGTENFLETSEPVMEELVDAFPELECDEPEFSIAELFELFPTGTYEFDGRSVENEELEGEAELEHVIPAAVEITGPEEEAELSFHHVVISWEPVDAAILPGLGRGPGMDEVTIVKYQVVVEREEVGGVPAPKVVFNVDLAPEVTAVVVPPEFLEPDAAYKFEVLSVDISGNQTIAEREFETR